MPLRSTISMLLPLALIGCSKADKDQDAFVTNAGGVAAFQVQCVGETNDDGKCKVKSKCTKDSDSDCKIYIDACVGGGNYYQGTQEGGTCTRVL